jgi:hypothetical protein
METIKLVGSIVGLLTGLFVFFDRILRGRPIAYFTVRGEGESKEAVVCVRNASQHDILVFAVEASPSVYFFVMKNDTRDVIKGAMGKLPQFILPRESDKDVFLGNFFENNVPKDLKPQKVRIKISWRRGNMTWVPQIPVIVWTDTETVKKFGLREYD